MGGQQLACGYGSLRFQYFGKAFLHGYIAVHREAHVCLVFQAPISSTEYLQKKLIHVKDALPTRMNVVCCIPRTGCTSTYVDKQIVSLPCACRKIKMPSGDRMKIHFNKENPRVY